MSRFVSRRRFLKLLLAVPASAALGACATPTPATAPSAPVQALQPTPACGDDDDDPTPPQTAGPFYTPNSPERTSLLEPGEAVTTLTLTGVVFNTACQPLPTVLLDFWHADGAGVYDNTGYRRRGHQFSQADGRYSLTTELPGLYPGRTRHIHVRVQAANQPPFITQIYFPAEAQNARDGLYRPELLLTWDDPATRQGTFNFVLDIRT